MDIKIVEKDITGILKDKVTVCILQLKPPFFDECEIKLIGGKNVLACDYKELGKRRRKIIAILKELYKYRDDINVIILPEYSLHYSMKEKLQEFSDSYGTILVGSFYDDRELVDNKKNKCYRRNILDLTLPKRFISETFFKLEKTYLEKDFLEDVPEEDLKILKLSWSIDNGQKMYLQIFLCSDFLEYFDKIDRDSPGIIVVPMSSPHIDEFIAPSKFCIRSHRESKTQRCVILCNSVTLQEQNVETRMIGSSQVFGPHDGKLPKLPHDSEGGIILTIRPKNILTKPKSIPSIFNVVIENPVSFLLKEEKGVWKILETPKKKVRRWVINPQIFEILNLGLYFLFARIRSYSHWRNIISQSLTKSVGIAGRDDLVTICLAEEATDARMFLYAGRSDLASSIESDRYFHVSRRNGFFKYKGYKIDPEEDISPYVDLEFFKHRPLIYRLTNGILETEKIDERVLGRLEGLRIILGEERDVFHIDDPKFENELEVLIGVFLPARRTEPDPCEIFNKEVIEKQLLDDPRVKDIYYSSGGGAGGKALPMHYLVRIIGNMRTVNYIILESIQKPLQRNNIEFGTRNMPLVDYLSDNEYEALLHAPVYSASRRRVIREIIDLTADKLGIKAVLIKRLTINDLEKMMYIYEKKRTLSNILGLEINDKLAKLIRGWTLGKLSPQINQLNGIYDDISDLTMSIAKQTERIIRKNVIKKRHSVGEDIFDNEVVSSGGKKINNSSGLNDLMISTSIWNSSHEDNPILEPKYDEKIRELQRSNANYYRNVFSHPDETFMKNLETISLEIDAVINTIILMIDFIVDYSYSVDTQI